MPKACSQLPLGSLAPPVLRSKNLDARMQANDIQASTFSRGESIHSPASERHCRTISSRTCPGLL